MWYANTHESTDLFTSGNADATATHRGMFVMAMPTFATVDMTGIRMGLQNWREYLAVGTAVYFLSPRDPNDTPMVRLWIVNKIITALFVIHLRRAISSKKSPDQET
jgi:hypothetical protein